MLGGIQVISVFAVAHAGRTEHTALLEGVLAIVGGGQVSTLAAGTGNDNHRSVGECQGIVIDVRSFVVGLGGLGERPVLTPHANHGTGGTEVGIELGECGVVLNSGVGQALQQRHSGVSTGQGAGTGTAVDGVRSGPAKGVDLGVLQGQDVVFIFQKDNTLLGDRGAKICGRADALLTDAAAAHRQVDDGIDRAGQNQVNDDDQGQHKGQPGVAADQLLAFLGKLYHSDGDDDGQHQADGKGNQVPPHQTDDCFHVINVDTQHFSYPPCFLTLVLSGVSPGNCNISRSDGKVWDSSQTVLFSSQTAKTPSLDEKRLKIVHKN